MLALPLAGRRVLVTRAVRQAGKLSDALRALGAEPVEVPVLEIAPPADLAPLDSALRSLDSYDWLILTSANTVRAVVDHPAGAAVVVLTGVADRSAVADAVPVPVIASGGVGTLDHLADGVQQGGADAVLAASIFHYGEFTVAQAKARMAERGIPVRF